MKKFLIKSLIFGFLLGLFLSLSYGINQRLFKSDFFKLDPEIITLINGDSHAAFSLNSLYIKRGVNVAQEGESFLISYYKLKVILTQNPQIRNVVLSFSPHNLSAYNDRKFKDSPWVDYIFDKYYSIIGYDDIKEQEINKIKFYKSFFLNQISLNQDYVTNRIKIILGQGTPQYPYIGHFRPFTGSYLVETRLQNAINRHYYYHGEICGISKIEKKYLNKIVKLMQTLQVNLYLVNPPLHTEYLRNIPAVYKEEFERQKIKLSSEALVHICDFGQLELNDSCFFDFDHLNIRGAKLFTSELNNYIYGEKSPVTKITEMLKVSAGR